MEEFVETENIVVNTGLEIRIEDFCTVTEVVKLEHTKHDSNYKMRFSVSVFPNGCSAETEGWLVVLPIVIEHNLLRTPENGDLSWIVSLIDNEGQSKFPRSFKKLSSDTAVNDLKYLKRSFIFNRADEVLLEGVLTLRCDISCYLDIVKNSMVLSDDMMLSEITVTCTSSYDFFPSIPKIRLRKGGDPRNSSDTFMVYDFTFHILTLPKFHELRRKFGVYGIPPRLLPPGSNSKSDSTYNIEHVWIFDTDSDRFLLSLDERQESVGARLLKASPVLRAAVNTTMREHFEKHYIFSDVKSQTFKLVLTFLEEGMFPSPKFHEVVAVYKFSHMYEITLLQQKCAAYMVRGFEIHTVYEEIKQIADLYEDEHLSTMLHSRWRKYESFGWKFPLTILKDEKYDFEQYI